MQKVGGGGRENRGKRRDGGGGNEEGEWMIGQESIFMYMCTCIIGNNLVTGYGKQAAG